MSTHLITGYAGKEHITSADQGSFNAAVMGGGEFILERGEQFRCQVVSNNKVRIYDGDALMQGRHIIIDRNTYEETTHDNGTQGYKRIDLIVLTYEKNAVTSVESVKLEVIKGSPAESNPTVPEYTKGDILNSGASKNQMPLYQIPFDGLSIGEPVKLFTTVPTLEGMKADVDGKVDAKIAEFEEDFAELEAGIEGKIAEAGKPLASNAADWAMIENYGEYSADAKTVGEEFSKVNNSLGGFQFKTVDGEKQVSTDGGETWENFSSEPVLLWENTGSTDSGSSHDVSGYKHLVIDTCYYSGTQTARNYVDVKEGSGTLSCGYAYSTYYIGSRRDYTITNGVLTFASVGYGGGNTSIDYGVPLAIYGIK